MGGCKMELLKYRGLSEEVEIKVENKILIEQQRENNKLSCQLQEANKKMSRMEQELKALNLIKSDNEAKQIINEILIDSLVNERKEKNKYKSQLEL